MFLSIMAYRMKRSGEFWNLIYYFIRDEIFKLICKDFYTTNKERGIIMRFLRGALKLVIWCQDEENCR